MPLALDISTDFATITDGLVAVTVGAAPVDACLRREVSTKEAAASNGKYLTSDTVFHLDVAEHASRPAIGGTITDADGNWTILSVAKQTLANRWRCISRQLYIDPTFVVTIMKATFAKSKTGAQEPTFAIEAANVVAKIQVEAETMEGEHQYRTTRRLATVYFLTQYALTANHRIHGPSGEVLKVLSWSGFDPIEQLFAAKCEVSKWPQS